MCLGGLDYDQNIIIPTKSGELSLEFLGGGSIIIDEDSMMSWQYERLCQRVCFHKKIHLIIFNLSTWLTCLKNTIKT